jgi:hypothetical protein
MRGREEVLSIVIKVTYDYDLPRTFITVRYSGINDVLEQSSMDSNSSILSSSMIERALVHAVGDAVEKSLGK